MKLIDTCSLLSLVRYYLPFDKENILFDFVKSKIESKKFIILDKVFEECRHIAKGVIVEKLNFLSEKKNLVKTDELLPTKKFFNQVDNSFTRQDMKKKLNNVEFEKEKKRYLETADGKLILYGLEIQKKKFVSCTIITEETKANNDNKLFKKLPAICEIKEVNLKVMTIPELLKSSEEINLIIK